MKTSKGIKNIALALLEFQKNVPSINKNAKAYNYKYADLPELVSTIQPHLTTVGIVWVQNSHYDIEGNCIGISTMLIHAESEEIFHFDPVMCPVEKNAKNIVQGIGKDTTYLRRYSLQTALGLVCEEDTDGVKDMNKQNRMFIKNTSLNPDANKEKGRNYLMMLCKEYGVGDDERYQITKAETGKSSSKELSIDELRIVCNAIKNIGVRHS